MKHKVKSSTGAFVSVYEDNLKVELLYVNAFEFVFNKIIESFLNLKQSVFKY